MIIYEILQGSSPYVYGNESQIPQLNFDNEEAPGFNKGWPSIISKATAENPEERFQTLNEFEFEIKKLYFELSAEIQEI